MSDFSIFGISGSALNAQSVRLNTIASNMANADSVSSSIEQTYKARHPVFKTLIDELSPESVVLGVKMAGVVESDAPLVQEYAPDHPLANEEGYIFRPNVNMVEQMADMISASRQRARPAKGAGFARHSDS